MRMLRKHKKRRIENIVSRYLVYVYIQLLSYIYTVYYKNIAITYCDSVHAILIF